MTIKKNEIYEGGSPFKELIVDYDKLIKNTKLYIAELDKLGEKIKNDLQKNTIKSTKDLRENNKTQKAAAGVISQRQKATKDLTVYQKEQQKLQKAYSREQAKVNSQETKINKTLIQQKAINADRQKDIKQRLALMRSERGSIDQLQKVNAILVKRRKNLNLESEKGRKAYERLTRAIDRNGKQLKKHNEAIGRHTDNVGNYKSATEGMGSAFKNMAAGALIVVAAIIKIVQGIQQFITRTEEGQDKWDIFMAQIDTLTALAQDKVTDFIDTLSDQVFTAENLEKVWQGVKQTFGEVFDFIKQEGSEFLNSPISKLKEYYANFKEGAAVARENLVDAFKRIYDVAIANFDVLIERFNLGWQKAVNIFTDNTTKVNQALDLLEDAQEKARKANEEFKKDLSETSAIQAVGDSIEWLTERYGKLTEETDSALAEARRLAKEQNQLYKDERELLVETAKERTKIEANKRKARELEYSDAQQAIKLLQEANAIEVRLENKSTQLALRKYHVLRDINKITHSNREAKNAEAQAYAAFYNQQAQTDAKVSANLRRINTLQQRVNAEEKQARAAIIKQRQEELNLLAKRIEVAESAFQTLVKETEADDALMEKELELDQTQNDRHEAELKRIQEEKDAARQAYLQRLRDAASVFDQIGQIAQQTSNLVNNLIQLEQMSYRDAADATEEEREANAEKRKEVEKKYANFRLAAQIAEIISSTALAIATILGQTGVFAPPFIALAAANGAVQLAIAKKQRDQIQSLESGGLITDYGVVTGDRHSAPSGGEDFKDHVKMEAGEKVSVWNRPTAQRNGDDLKDLTFALNSGLTVDDYIARKSMNLSMSSETKIINFTEILSELKETNRTLRRKKDYVFDPKGNLIKYGIDGIDNRTQM